MLQRILFFTLFILLICACGARPRATSAPLATATPTSGIPHEPGVADLWRNRPPAGELVEVDAYFSGAMPYPMFGGEQPPSDLVVCPMIWRNALSDQPFLPALHLLNSVRSNTLPDDGAWLLATIPEATKPGEYVEPNFPYHARFRGRFGEPAFAHCEQAERIFVVEEVIIIYEEQVNESTVERLDLPDGYDNWPRYHDAALGYSVPYPPDWTVEALSEAQHLGAVALRAPQSADYPIIVRVHEGETSNDQYDPSSISPLFEQTDGWGLFEQGWTFQARSETQNLSGYSLDFPSIANKDKAMILFSAHGRTYELSLEYPMGFEADQSLLTNFSAIVTGFQLDLPPGPTATPPIKQTLGEGPFLNLEEVLASLEEREQQTLEIIYAQVVSEAHARLLAQGCGTFFGHPDGVWVITVRGYFEEDQRTLQLFIDATTGEQLCGEEIQPQAAPQPTLAPNTTEIPAATETTVPVAPTPAEARAFKGMELYSWQDENDEWVYSILIGTNREKERSEVEAAALDLNGVKEMISEMPAGEYLSWRNQVYEPSSKERIILPFPPDEIIQELNAFALSRDIELFGATE